LPFAKERKEFHDFMMNFEKLVGSSGRWSSYFWGRKFLTWGSRQERRNGKPRNFICHDKTQKD